MVKWHARISLFVHQRERNERSPHWESIPCTKAIIIVYMRPRSTPSIYGRVIRVFADGNSVSRGDPSLFVSRQRPKAATAKCFSARKALLSLSFCHLMLLRLSALILCGCFLLVWKTEMTTLPLHVRAQTWCYANELKDGLELMTHAMKTDLIYFTFDELLY